MQSYIYNGYSTKNRRDLNMDSLLLKERKVDGKTVYLMVVCDGVGSMAEGAFAASMSVNLLSDWLDALTERRGIGLRLRNRVMEINQIILEQAELHRLQTATTLSALLITDSRFYIVHAGDSRIYGCCNGVLRLLTCDHHSADGKLTSCIGRTGQPELFYNEGDAEETRFLICSDGLYKRMDMAYLQQALEGTRKKNIRNTMEQLVQYVVERGETDNISVSIIVRER